MDEDLSRPGSPVTAASTTCVGDGRFFDVLAFGNWMWQDFWAA
jgi:hypothetical protein